MKLNEVLEEAFKGHFIRRKGWTAKRCITKGKDGLTYNHLNEKCSVYFNDLFQNDWEVIQRKRHFAIYLVPCKNLPNHFVEGTFEKGKQPPNSILKPGTEFEENT